MTDEAHDDRLASIERRLDRLASIERRLAVLSWQAQREQLRDLRQQAMDLIAEAIVAVKDNDPARHALSILWGKLRDVKL
jgi:uncharacterized protein YbjQ (UPF0145 family)